MVIGCLKNGELNGLGKCRIALTVLRDRLEYEVTISSGTSWMAVLYFSLTIFNSNVQILSWWKH